jgi:hypothetical protein
MNSNTINNTVAAPVNITAKEIREKRNLWAINHDARLSELERGVRDAMLGREGWNLEFLAGDSNGRKLGLVHNGEHVGTFFGRYLSGDCLGRPGGYGVTWQSEFQQELKQNPIDGIVYEWEARGRGLGADMRHGIPYESFKIEMTSQNIAASSEMAATQFAELLVAFENRKFAQDMQWQVSKCYCWGKGTCDRCKHLKEEAILQAG